MASRAIKYPGKKSWSKPMLRKLDGESAERAMRIMLERHGPDILNNSKSKQ
jgi:hypothetical protein